MKKILRILFSAAVLLSVTYSGAQAQTSAPTGNAEKGKAVFMRVGCYECHGTVGQGGTGPRLGPNPIPLERMTAFVRKPVGMPAYSAKVLSDAEVADIRTYLATAPTPPPLASIPLLNQ